MISCGIDFGTSNSAIAIADEKNVRLAPVENAEATLPSAIFYPRGRPPIYGRAAQKTFFDGHEGRFMRSLKRMLGTELMNWGTIVNDRPRRFDEIIGGFIAHLKKAGEAAADSPIDHVIMGRPVHFVDGDPGADYAAEQQLERIAQAAGFKHVSFQFEPIAAAFAHEQTMAEEQLALVADIGGGTSDFTVIRIGGPARQRADRSRDILGNSGIRTGGNDFDKNFSLAHFMPALGYDTPYGPRQVCLPRAPFHDLSEWAKINFVYVPKTVNELKLAAADGLLPVQAERLLKVLHDELGHQLLAQVEQTKIILSDEPVADIALDFIAPGFDLRLEDADLIAATAAQTAAIVESLDDCLQQAGVAASDINVCVLTGGPTAMPALAAALLASLPHARLSAQERMSSVATGLGHAAQQLYGH